MGDRLFFCYARADQGFAVPLARELKNRGVRVWLDQWDIPAEADWDKTIDQALRNCDRLLIVLSPASVQSSEVRGELREALDLGKPILPVLYRPCEIPRQLRLVQFVDFSGRKPDDEDSLNRLLSACRSDTESATSIQSAPAPEAKTLDRQARRPSLGTRSKILIAAVLILLAAISWFVLSRKAEERQRMNSAALSPDGSYLAAATGQGLGVGIARVWDVSSGRQLHRFTTKEGPFWVVAWSPAGNNLAIGDHQGKIWIYEAATWKLSHELDGPRSFIKFIAWSRDGKTLATGDDTGTLWAWDAIGGKRLFQCSPHSKNIDAAAWSPNGERLATASWDSSVAVVDGHNGHLLSKLQRHTSHVNAVAWSPDGKWIASGSLESPYLIVWDASGQPRILEGHRGSVARVGWSSDGRYLASASKDNTIQFWDGQTFNNAGRFDLQGAFNSGENLAWSNEGNRLASGDDANVWILAPPGTALKQFAGYAKNPYSSIEIGGWSLGGKRLAAFRSNDGARVWDVATGNLVGSFRVGFFDAITN